MAWKEWYGLRLIDEFRQTDDTAAFSRSAEALTDFLASLPPTKQVRIDVSKGGWRRGAYGGAGTSREKRSP